MNIELIKKASAVFAELSEAGIYGIYDNRLQVDLPVLKEMENLQIVNRNDDDYPYEIFTVIEGITIFSLADENELNDFPQFKEFRKADLKRKLAALEAELEKEEDKIA